MNQNVEKFIKATPVPRLFISVLSVGELRRHAGLLREAEPDSATQIEDWLDETQRSFEDRILPVDSNVARSWAALPAEDTGAVLASLIAATAECNNLVLVTRNAHAARGTSVRTLNPWHTAHRTRPAPPTGDAS